MLGIAQHYEVVWGDRVSKIFPDIYKEFDNQGINFLDIKEINY